MENDVRVGARVRMQTGAYVTAWSVVEDDVFIAPGVMLTNDPTAGRRPPAWSCAAPTLRRAAASALALCCCRGSRSARTRSWRPAPWSRATCRPGALVMGVPARVVRRGGEGERVVRRRAGAGAGTGDAGARGAGHRRGAAVVVVEVRRVWRRGSAPAPEETDHPILAAEEAVAETARVARAGYREVSTRENSMFNLLTSFATTFILVRSVTYALRGRPTVGPFRNMRVGRRHIHHFVPGIVIAFGAGPRRS